MSQPVPAEDTRGVPEMPGRGTVVHTASPTVAPGRRTIVLELKGVQWASHMIAKQALGTTRLHIPHGVIPRDKVAVLQDSWRLKGIGILRIVFGVVWGVDAWFKWQPDFINNFTQYLSDAGAHDGQPTVVKAWIGFWVNTVNVDPHVFANFVAVAETLIAIALILGIFSNLTYAAGSLLCVVIWTTAESFGGPYTAGSTDIGAAIIYGLVFAGLFLAASGRYVGLDSRLGKHLGRFSVLASGNPEQPAPTVGDAG